MKKIYCLLFVIFSLVIFCQITFAEEVLPDNEPSTTDLYVEKIYNNLVKKCWTCIPVGQFFNLAAVLSINVSYKIAGYVKYPMLVIFGIWLLFQIGRFVLPFGSSKELSNTIGQVGKRAFLVSFVYAFLQMPALLWEYVIDPLTYGSISISKAVQTTMMAGLPEADENTNSSILGIDFSGGFEGIVDDVLGLVLNIDHDTECAVRAENLLDMSTEFSNIMSDISADTPDPTFEANTNVDEHMVESRHNLMIQMCMAQSRLGAGMALGRTAMQKGDPDSEDFEYKDPYYAGFALFIVFGLILVALPLFLIESIFRIAIVGLFSPLFAIMTLIPSLQKVTFAAIKSFFQALLTIIFIGVMVGTGGILLNGAVSALGGDNLFSVIVAAAEHIGSEFLSEAASFGEEVLEEAGYASQESLISLTSPLFWAVFISGMLTLLMTMKVSSLAGALVGGPSDPGAAATATQMGMSYGAMSVMRGGSGLKDKMVRPAD